MLLRMLHLQKMTIIHSKSLGRETEAQTLITSKHVAETVDVFPVLYDQ